MSELNDDDRLDSGEKAAAPPVLRRSPQPGGKLLTLATNRRVRSRDEIVREAQDYFRSLAPPDRVLSEELIAERQQEFLTEETEFDAAPSGT